MIKRLEDMTEIELEDWDNRHKSVLRWYGMWKNLIWIFFAIGVYLIFTDHTAWAWLFVGFEWIFLVGLLVCARRHTKLHEEIGE
ncbi:hypothetical protein [Mycobacteroides abscessus]|uniref:hypothetical protein n=1 Tax=Mycobacteroides abscessus TaxID=36809 RepID=UPI000C2689F7|nr:hypothetical protein [Mycobacteroides abscessus]